MNLKDSQQGVSLYLAIMVMTVLLAIVLGVSAILLSQQKMVRGMGYSVMAFYAADTGIERVLYDFEPTYSETLDNGATIEVTMVCSPDHPDCPLELGFIVDPNCQASYFCIKSIGEYKETKRAIEATL